MTPDEAQQIVATSMLMSGVSLVIALGVYVWYAVMLAKVFAQFGRPAWAAWIPVYNEMQLFRIGGQQQWFALLLYVPFVSIIGLVFKVFALHRISTQSWRGVGTTVLGVLLPPVWATVLAVGPSPDPERGRMPRGPVTGAIPPVQPNGPLASPFDGAPVPAAMPVPASLQSPAGAAPLPAWLVPGSPASAAPAPSVPAPSVPAPSAPAAAAPASPASASAAPQPTAPADPGSSPFAPPAAFAAAEPDRVPGRIEPLPPMPGSVPGHPEVQAPPPSAAPQLPAQPPLAVPPQQPTAAFVPGANPFIAPPTVAPPGPTPAANPFAAPAPAALPPTGARAVATPLDAFDLDDGATIVTGDDDPFDRTVVVERRPAFLWRLLLADGTALALEGPAVLLGRNPRSGDAAARALVVPDPSRTLSKTHALIRFDGQQWWVTDLDSTNGVLLADETGADRLIEVGVPTPFSDRFVLGTLEVRVQPDPLAGAAYR